MLIGSYTSSFKKDRRIAVPANFRKELGTKLIIARWYENCLVLISKEKWQELMGRITGQSNFVTEPVRNTDRFILGSAYEVSSDAQGRILVPSLLAQYAQLESQVIFVGLGDRVEIWEKKYWERQEQFVAQNASQMMERVASEKSNT
jgi:MraZ protein